MLRLLVLKILTPVTLNSPPGDYILSSTIAEPLPGEFLSRRKTSRPTEPWTVPLDRKSVNVEALRDFITERALEKEKYHPFLS